ncbi:glycosyltransferase family 2 protein [Pseudomonas cremoricolorata]|uniref:glycosyltransferase family 2 protein n=1 Tax=Pseudomonas cremoricolorata TaxID=157783 RepID=UPI00041ADB22|nr:glycosyltransferase family 2 protein [Pseudomonas cremoricolorata]
MIIIPMVGKSSRFFKAGFTRPKYELLVNGETVFSRAVRSFEHYFKTDHFRFLVRNDYEAPQFVEAAVKALGISDYSIVVFEADTLGQADTVYQGLKDIDSPSPLYIFNIDTFRPDFRKPEWVEQCDGYLEVFRHGGSHWSFVEPGEDNAVLRTTEKVRISDLCSDGLYYFKNKLDFDRIFRQAFETQDTAQGEYYIAPLYNNLIQQGQVIKYELVPIEDVIFCGTPDEYAQLLDDPRVQ